MTPYFFLNPNFASAHVCLIAIYQRPTVFSLSQLSCSQKMKGSNLSLRSRSAVLRLSKFANRFRSIRSIHPAYFLSFALFTYIIFSPFYFCPSHPDFSSSESPDAHQSAKLLQDDDLVRQRLASARNASVVSQSAHLGNHFCIIQPTLSAGKDTWKEEDAKNHIAIRAFMRTFVDTVTEGERRDFKFSIYYGHDSDDKVFGDPKLRPVFKNEAKRILQEAGFQDDAVKLVFTPLYGLHGRINAIWNVLAKDAYYDGCDYFFLSNDDMVFLTKGWVSRSRDSLNGIGSPVGKKRPCRYFGIVRFKDEWASWATFTFHVSTRMHMEIFGGVYYPVPYKNCHNDYWINFVYSNFEASKYRGEVKVRNRVQDVEYVLKHPKDKSGIAPARYEYDERGNARKHIDEGRARVRAWLEQYRHTERCLPPL